MKCPIDQTELLMTARHGVEIDYCPTCRGVWLDRGELDKIIERAVPPVAVPEPAARQSDRPDRGRDHHRKKRRKSFLEEIFDFD